MKVAWCPCCNLELNHYDRIIAGNSEDEIEMFAILPERPDVTMATVYIEKLNFQVLIDVDNRFAEKLGLVYELSWFVKFFTKAKGGDLKKSQGNDNSELPISATYEIDGKGVIKNAWLDVDFTKRAEPSEVIDAYRKIS